MICDECQTLAHCMNHGCIPITEEKIMSAHSTPLHTLNGRNVIEDGKALKKKPIDIATLVFEAGVLFLIMLPIFC